MVWKLRLKRFWIRNRKKLRPSFGFGLIIVGIYAIFQTMPGWIFGVGGGAFSALLGLSLLKK